MDANYRRAQSRRQMLSAFADRRGELDLQSTGFKSQTIMRVGPLGPAYGRVPIKRLVY